MKLTSIEEAESMIGERVKALGVCGQKDGITVIGTLKEIQPCGDAIVEIEYGKKNFPMKCLVNRFTLELVNGRCKNCNNTISDAEAFNQVCFGCGKKV